MWLLRSQGLLAVATSLGSRKARGDKIGQQLQGLGLCKKIGEEQDSWK
jgi:hypothetical protein